MTMRGNTGFSFATTKKGFWNNIKNQRRFLDGLGEQLGIKSWEDWYSITKDILKKNGGKALLARYENSPSKLLSFVYPEYPWKLSRFGFIPNDFWLDFSDNEKESLDLLGTRIGIKSMEDWYNVSTKDILANGGNDLLDRYNNSPSKLLKKVYSHHNWKFWKFKRTPKGSWDELDENLSEFIYWLEEKLNFRSLDDWYRVSVKQIQGVVSLNVFQRHPLEKILQEVYPHHPWDVLKFNSKTGNIRASQRVLATLVQELFPDSGRK